MLTLVVISQFEGREIGQPITDPAEVRAVLAGGNAHRVVRADHASGADDATRNTDDAQEA